MISAFNMWVWVCCGLIFSHICYAYQLSPKKHISTVNNLRSKHRNIQSFFAHSSCEDHDHDILVRAYKGEETNRSPVWLMRQAGRYMAEFRNYSEKYPFRTRSETPDIAIELSLQPWRRFKVDGVILFSDILTPLPALGVDFTIIEGKGPKISQPIRSLDQVQKLSKLVDIDKQLPFIRPILNTLRDETKGKTSLIGFIGAPWTLAAYSVEGGHSKLCRHMKTMCLENPTMAHALLDHYTTALCDYAAYQISCGAQVLQVFESWAHHMSEDMFDRFAKPYADRVAHFLHHKYPHVPIIYFANGGSAFLRSQFDMAFDAWSIDWQISMASARKIAGPTRVLAGNIDPIVLYGSEKVIETAVKECIDGAGKGKHVMNLGHGVEKDMSEDAVASLVHAVKNYRY